MTFLPSHHYLVIYGGRVDLDGSNNYHCFKEVSVLHVASQIWATVAISGSPPPSRNGHAISAVGNRLVIFGGMRKGKFVGSTTWILDLDQDEVKRVLAEEA
jgi:hypothetical protein